MWQSNLGLDPELLPQTPDFAFLGKTGKLLTGSSATLVAECSNPDVLGATLRHFLTCLLQQALQRARGDIIT